MTALREPVVLSEPAAEPVVLEHTVVVQAAFELAGLGREPLLPVGLAPTIPTLLTFLSIHVPNGPLGPMAIATARLSCRSGVRARAYVVASEVEAGDETVRQLAAGWGLGGTAGEVGLERRYDRVSVTVAGWGLRLVVGDPSPISSSDVQYVTGLHPVRAPSGDSRLAQVEVDVALERAERGRPRVEAFDGLTVRGRLLVPAHPVAATIGAGTVTLPRVRFLLDPDLPPHLGTEVIAPVAAEGR
jgi:hypothetical protein